MTVSGMGDPNAIGMFDFFEIHPSFHQVPTPLPVFIAKDKGDGW